MIRGLMVVAAVGLAASLAFSRSWRNGPSQGQSSEPKCGRAQAATDSRPAPKAVADEVFHQFGILDPAEPCEYTFWIKNAGTGPLKISKGGTSCKCTVSVLPAEDIPPGKKGPVQIASKVDQTEGDFTHSATILTNDPANPAITFTIAGTVRQRIAASPPGIVLSGLRRGEVKQVDATVYSEVWDNFAVSDIQASLKGTVWELEPAPAELLEPLKAKSGYRFRITLPADLPSGNFAERLSMVIRPDDPWAEPRPFELPLTGNVPGGRTVYGEKIDYRGVVHLGPLRPGEGAKARLTMTLREEPRSAKVIRVEKEPDFLVVDAGPYKPGSERIGIYKIDIEVPRDAPPSNYMRHRAAKVKVALDHPTLPEVELKVEFAVLNR